MGFAGIALFKKERMLEDLDYFFEQFPILEHLKDDKIYWIVAAIMSLGDYVLYRRVVAWLNHCHTGIHHCARNESGAIEQKKDPESPGFHSGKLMEKEKVNPGTPPQEKLKYEVGTPMILK